MKCASCSQENPEGSRYCNKCGQPLTFQQPLQPGYVKPVETPVPRRCVSCGRDIDYNVNVCPYCGHDYRYKGR